MGIIISIVVIFVIYRIIHSILNKPSSSSKEPELGLRVGALNSGNDQNNIDRQERSRGKSAKWYEPGETVNIQGHQIDCGLIYVGEQLLDLSGYENDACLINPKLKTVHADPWEGAEDLGYWPKYGRILPKCRGAYLTWLAGGRCEPEAYIGYVFIFFYGLERRLLIDGPKGKVSEKERAEIVQEVNRLLTIYGSNRSFKGYANKLLAMEWILFQLDKPLPGYIDFSNRYSSGPFQVLLAQHVVAEKAISAELALQWLNLYPEFVLRTPARRCAKEFNELFKRRFNAQFEAGYFVKANKTPLKLEYHAASPSILDNLKIKSPNLPNPFILTAPLKKLSTLAEECTVELDAYSRYLGRKDNDPKSLGALSLLPKELMRQSPAVQKIQSYLTQSCTNGPCLVPVSELYNLFDEKMPAQLAKKDAEILSTVMEGLGYGTAPDLRFHHIKPAADGKIVIFPNGHPINFHPSKEFRTVGAILRLGAMVSQIDDQLSPSEVATLQALVINNPVLTQPEKDSLLAFLQWCLYTPQGTAGIKQMFAEVSSAEKIAISHILISVAYADGQIDPKEIKQLEKLYTSLGLDKEQVTSDLHTLASANNPITIELKDKDDSFSITQPGRISEKTKGFSLNEELIRIREEETRQVKGVLEEIFAEQVEDATTVDDVPATNTPINPLEGLDSAHQNLLAHLLKQETWAREEIVAHCKELDLMADGAMEVLNEWAFENANAPLIDDGDPVYVDINLAKEITNG